MHHNSTIRGDLLRRQALEETGSLINQHRNGVLWRLDHQSCSRLEGEVHEIEILLID